MGWIVDVLYSICMFFDWLVYSLATTAYVLFATMCDMNLTAFGSIIKNLISRIEVFLGIVMLFVVAFNLIQFLADPSKAEKGVGNLVKKIAISIALIVSSNFIFGLLDEFQEAIVKGGAIQKLVLGINSSETGNSSFESYIAAGKYFSYNMLFSFVTGEPVENDIMDGNASLWEAVEHINDAGVKYEYPIVSTASGILLIIMFVSFAIDVGARVFTLLVLQAISPIPILAYIVPGGDSILKKYFKAYVQVYVELFVKIALSYLTLYLMRVVMDAIGIADRGGTSGKAGAMSLFPAVENAGGYATSFFKVILVVLLVIAIYTFVRKIPTMLQSIFGFNISGGSFSSTSSVIRGLGIGALGLGAGAIGGTIASAANGSGFGGAVLGGVRGALGGATSGYQDGSHGRSIADTFRNQSSNITTQGTRGRQIGEQGGLGRMMLSRGAHAADGVANFFHGTRRRTAENQLAQNRNAEAQNRIKNNIQKNQEYRNRVQAVRTAGENGYLRQFSRSAGINFSNKSDAVEYMSRSQRAAYDAAMQSGDAARIESTRTAYQQALKTNGDNYETYVNQYTEHEFATDAGIQAAVNDANTYSTNEGLGYAEITDYASYNSRKTDSESTISTLQSDLQAEEATGRTLQAEAENASVQRTADWVNRADTSASEHAAHLGHNPGSNNNSNGN